MVPSIATTTIYIVDDDPSVRRALKRVFSTAGFSVLTFESAEEYLQQNVSQTESCLVLDIHLRGMSGLELLEILKKNHRAIPTVVITAHDEENIRTQVLEAGAKFLVKPIKETVLMEAVEQALK
jgi:FixJ family two-component response regulator